jgi:mannose-1-phosphate guanylyltransferase/mannose-6-phosphate isomerase
LWPLSRPTLPKQFLKVIGQKSLLQLAVQRCLGLGERPWVITQPCFEALVREQVDAGLILEPVARSTAPALMLALATLQCDFDEPIFIGPADHLIAPEETFVESVQEAATLALGGWLVTFGVRPTRPETGFGYIEAGEGVEVRRFVEKPDLQTAVELVASGHFWNSGMFCMTPRIFWEQLQLHAPALGQFQDASAEQLVEAFEQIDSISIDYALMERSKRVAMVPLNCSWSDLGSWDQFYDLLEKDPQANAIVGTAHPMNSSNNLVYGRERPIALIDCDNLIVVDAPEALLISRRGSSQKVRQLSTAPVSAS